MKRLPAWMRRDWLNRLIYREVSAQTAPVLLHVASIEAHLVDIEANLTALGERINERDGP